MAISYKYNDKRVSLFPLICDTKKGNKFYMCPIWKPGEEKAVFPYACKHVLQLSHDEHNISAVCRRAFPSGTSNMTMSVYGIRFRQSNGYVTDTTYGQQSNAGLNPYYFYELGCPQTARFAAVKRPRVTMSAWPGDSACTSETNAIWEWRGQTNGCPHRNACIYLGGYDNQSIHHGAGYAAYGFVIALNKPDYWSTTSVWMEMGQIFAVDKGNTAHSITLYYKGSTKGGLSSPTSKYYTKEESGETKNGYYKYQSYKPGHLREIFRFYGKDSDISGFNVGGKTYRTTAENWNQYHSSYYSGAEPNQDRYAKNVKIIGEDSTYKYIIAKGRHKISSADTHIFTPPCIYYSGNKSGVIEPLIIDAWIGFH